MFSHNFYNNLKSLGCHAVVSRDHKACLAAEHAECQRSSNTTEIGDATTDGAKSESNSPKTRFLVDDHTSRSGSNLIWRTTPRSLVNQLSGIPPVPTIHYTKKHLEGSQEGYSCLIAETYVAGALFFLSMLVAAQAILTKISFKSVATSWR